MEHVDTLGNAEVKCFYIGACCIKWIKKIVQVFFGYYIGYTLQVNDQLIGCPIAMEHYISACVCSATIQ
jgi:hypothetical protein